MEPKIHLLGHTACTYPYSEHGNEYFGDTLIPPRVTPNKYGVKMLILKSGNVVQCVCCSCFFFCSVLVMIKINTFWMEEFYRMVFLEVTVKHMR